MRNIYLLLKRKNEEEDGECLITKSMIKALVVAEIGPHPRQKIRDSNSDRYPLIFFFKWSKPGLFLFLFSFFSHDKYSTNTINEKSVDGMLGTQTRVAEW